MPVWLSTPIIHCTPELSDEGGCAGKRLHSLGLAIGGHAYVDVQAWQNDD